MWQDDIGDGWVGPGGPDIYLISCHIKIGEYILFGHGLKALVAHQYKSVYYKL
jgi:hypothetical protein